MDIEDELIGIVGRSIGHSWPCAADKSLLLNFHYLIMVLFFGDFVFFFLFLFSEVFKACLYYYYYYYFCWQPML